MSTTSLIARQCRLREWAQMVQDCRNRPEEMSVDEYLDLYRKLITLSMDADGFGLFETITERDIVKAKIIRAIIDVLDDVPHRRMKHIMSYKKVDYDVDEVDEMAYPD